MASYTVTPASQGEYPTLDSYQPGGSDYLGKVARGRSLLKADLDQPAFSEQAEMLRQVKASSVVIPGIPEDMLGEAESKYAVEGSDPSSGYSIDPVDPGLGTPDPAKATAKSLGSQYLGALAKAQPDFGDNFVSRGGFRGPLDVVQSVLEPPMKLLQTVFSPLTAGVPFVSPYIPAVTPEGIQFGDTPESSRDFANRMTQSYPSTDWRKNVIPGALEALHENAAGLVPIPLGMLSKAGKAKPGIPPSPVKPLTVTDLDIQVAEKAITKSAIETGAFPDAELVPARRDSTGNIITTPDFNLPQVEHTATQKGGVTRGPKGRFGRSSYPDLQPGEVREGQQTLLGGYPAETAPQGKYTLTPEEQVPFGMAPLRDQKLFKPGTTVEQQQAYSDFASKALKSRVLTPEMQRTLETPLAEQGNFPVRIQVSKSGLSASAGPQVNESFVLPNDLTKANTLDGAIFPSLYTRVSGSVTDVMRSAGPLGNGIADYVDLAYTNRAIGTSQDMIAVTQTLDGIFNRTSRLGRIGIMSKQLLAGENAFIMGGKKSWGYSDAIEEQIFNDMYTNGRMKATDPKAAQAADALFQQGTYPASSDPGVRTLKITNPFTGAKMDLGQPDKFMPQQPIHSITSKAINDTQWGILYERAGGEKLGISLDTYKKTIIKLSQHDPEVTAAKMKGLENMRLLDLEALGGSPYQWAKKLGYETDPFRAAFRFNSTARLRGQLAQIEAPVNDLLMRIPADQENAAKWLHLATERAMLNPGKYDALATTTNTIKGLSHMLDVTMLQLGGLANMAQASFIIARGGGRASVKGVFDMLTGKDRLIIEQSGAIFPAALNEMTNPTGPLATVSSGAFRLYGLAMIDRSTRYLAAHVGHQFINQLERNLLKAPDNQRLHTLLSELGGDPKVILQQGSIPNQMRLGMIQRFANHTAGVTDVRGTPLWASSENPWARLVNKYRTFATANSAELRRLIVNAPTAADGAMRVATLLASGYVIGGGINEGRKWLRDTLMGNEAKPDKSTVMRHAERVVQGLGTIEAMALINAVRDPGQAMLSFAAGPAGGTAASLLQDLVATAKHGLGWRSIDTISKRLPIVGPVVGPLVGKEVKRESRRQAEISRDLAE